MALPAILRRLFKSSGYGPELNDDLISRNIFIREWVNTYDYDAGVVVRGSDGKLYMSALASGPGLSAGAKNPVQDNGTYWICPKVPTAASGDSSDKIASTGFVSAALAALPASDGVPVGCVYYFAGTGTPAKYLLCDGAAVSRTTYSALFGIIGTRYGTGNGSTTFNVPNLIDRFPQGNATPGTVKAAGLPNITGSFNARERSLTGGHSGAFDTSTTTSGNLQYLALIDTKGKYQTCDIDASRSSSIYGKSSTVQPPALTLRPIIKAL